MTRPARPRPALTGRALLLGAVLVLLVVVLASPVRRYLQSRGDVTSSSTQLQRDRAELARLKAQQERYGDPGYIQQQARTRLQYSMPGDTTYTVVGQGARSEIEKTTGTAHPATSGTSWNTRLMDSVRAAAK